MQRLIMQENKLSIWILACKQLKIKWRIARYSISLQIFLQPSKYMCTLYRKIMS
uniref:Uncharacterized protein n=1 Tax=Rhizophora mucronata TaxID=61149 RepID=A0A2P2PPJ9_RHIMU